MKRLAIDFGSDVTKIYMPGCGVVLCEATCVAVEADGEGEERYAIKECGDKARDLYGRAAAGTHIINPVDEGDIVNENLAARLLEYFLEKVEITPRVAKKIEVMFVLPCGANAELKAKYAAMADECGIGTAYFTVTPFAAVLGQSISVSESTPVFSLDIGKTISNIAAFSQDGIISGLNVNLGGGNIDSAIIRFVAENFDLKIGERTAEKIKNVVGSLFPDDNKMTVIDGRGTDGGKPASIAVNSGDVLPLIIETIDKILEYANLVISKLPAEVSSSVMHGGIYLTGGVTKMDGLPDYVAKKLNIPVIVAEEPQLSTVIGAGTILTNDDLLEKLSTEC